MVNLLGNSMPKKKAVKKKKKTEIKSKKKSVKKTYLLSNLYGFLCLGLGFFVFVFQYFETQKGVFGYLIEVASLYSFGAIGFLLVPFLLVYCGAMVLFAKRNFLVSFLYSALSVSILHQFYLLIVLSKNSVSLKNYGYVGLFVNNYLLLLLGEVGGVVGLAVIFIVITSAYLGCSTMLFFKPFLIFRFPFKWIGAFISNLLISFVQEYKKVHTKPNIIRWIVHNLFFTKKVVYKKLLNKNLKNGSDITNELIKRTMKNDISVVQLDPSDTPFEFTPNELITDDSSVDINTLPAQDSSEGARAIEFLEDGQTRADNNDTFLMMSDDSSNLKDSTVTIKDSFNYEECDQDADLEKNDDALANVSVKFESSLSEDVSDEGYLFPSIELLEKGSKPKFSIKSLTKMRVEKASLLEETLASFNVKAKVVNITPGPSITRYELQPGDGVKISKITALSKDISLKLAASDIRIEAPIPGKALVGIEVPNEDVQMITLRSILEESSFTDSTEKLIAGLGKTITGDSIIMDLAKMPHVLIAGATGSGKSVCINTIILSILMRSKPSEVKFLMIDPKKVELSLYEGIPHLLAPVVTDPNKAAATLKRWALVEMENRYEIFSKVGVKDIKGFNSYVEEQHKNNEEDTDKEGELLQKLPFIVVIIDELADLMMVASQDVEQTICRLAQMARATGIHLVVATQRPSVNVVTGLIKANVPSRISFYLQSQIDSRTILDMGGAEKLLGKGDMLYSPVGSFNPVRAQGVFVSESEVKGVVAWLKGQGKPDYLKEIIEVEPLAEESSKSSSKSNQDELYEDAKQLIINSKYASTSYLQRKLRIGYNRAARIMDELESNGVISEYVGEKKSRQVI
jgi:DNA segregation ATPase FtsK/SpoIIIE, S-DNA-T family